MSAAASKILVTGFLPFQNEKINPSQLILEQLQDRKDVETVLLPVSYEQAFRALKTVYDSRGPYKGILMLGQAGGRKAMSLERIAVNWCESSLHDEVGYRPPLARKFIASAPASYTAEFFPYEWATELSKIAPTVTSFTAGTFVCNALFFETLNEFSAQNIPALFVHVPYLPEQVVGKPGVDSMPLKDQVAVVQRLLDLFHKV
jgi:pyroglutamyl-peptidase